MGKNNFQALQYARAQIRKQYWYGTFGQLGSEELLKEKQKQYRDMYKKWDPKSFEAGFGKKVHDCIGLAVKGYTMGDGDPVAPTPYNPKYDVSADGMMEICKISGDISTMPDIPGVLVWKPGHIGIYEGNGITIEAKSHSCGVVRTKDTKWKKWALCPWWEYITIESWITSLYRQILNREPDPDGLKYWRKEIVGKNQTPTQVIRFFLTSPELAQRNLSDDQFVAVLYHVFFDREPDEEGKNYWLGQIKTEGREKVVEGFLWSDEWADMEEYLIYIC